MKKAKFLAAAMAAALLTSCLGFAGYVGSNQEDWAIRQAETENEVAVYRAKLAEKEAKAETNVANADAKRYKILAKAQEDRLKYLSYLQDEAEAKLAVAKSESEAARITAETANFMAKAEARAQYESAQLPYLVKAEIDSVVAKTQAEALEAQLKIAENKLKISAYQTNIAPPTLNQVPSSAPAGLKVRKVPDMDGVYELVGEVDPARIPYTINVKGVGFATRGSDGRYYLEIGD